MKRFVAIMLMVGMFLCLSAPFASAQNYKPKDENYVAPGEDWVTRQVAVARFVRAVDDDPNFSKEDPSLRAFLDYGKIASAYRKEIALAVEKGWVEGYEDHTFRPQEPISRLEALVILKRILDSRTLPENAAKGFSDVPSWAADEIAVLEGAGIVQGYGDGTLGAEDLLTAEQLTLLTRRTVRLVGPQGNFYEYVNEDWLSETQIPQGQVAWSDLHEMTNQRQTQVAGLVYELYNRAVLKEETFEKGTSEQKIADVFSAGVNMVLREGLALDPVMPYLEQIEQVKTMDDLMKTMAALEKNGFHGLLPLSLEGDMMDATRYRLTFSQCYTGLNPDLVQGDTGTDAMTAYAQYLTNLFCLFGEEETSAMEKGQAVAALCKTLAEASMALDAHNDVHANYQLFDQKQRKTLFAHFPMEAYLKEMGYDEKEALLVYDKPLAQKADSLWEKKNLTLLKDYLKASVMDGAAAYLNTDAFLIWRNFQNALNGTQSAVMPQDYALSVVEELLGWDVAKLYVKTYGDEETNKEVTALTEDILVAYQNRIKNHAQMSEESKKTALLKLKKLNIRVGYPKDIETYTEDGPEIISTRDGGNLLLYRTAFCQKNHEKNVQRMKNQEKVDKNRWHMLPQTVNAMYDPSTNSITVPAGILDAPLYHKADNREKKLGSIGMVIAHEISHALDSLGSQFDENGNLKNWWQEEDQIAFDALCSQVEKAYDGIQVLPGICVNGKQTLSENMADLSAMACILDMVGKENPRLTDMMEAFATMWRMKTTEQYLRYQVETDSHAPEKVRVNRVLSNFDIFHELYHTKEGDGMYLPPDARIDIW